MEGESYQAEVISLEKSFGVQSEKNRIAYISVEGIVHFSTLDIN